MDLLTHAAVGAAGAASTAPARELRWAALVGAAAGLLPDADALITSASDPLLNLEFHRHFTHALAFVPLGALIAAALLWPLLRTRVPFARLYRYAFVGYLLSPLLDACTSYGTHLLWPLVEQPVAWSVIAIVDPLLTLSVLVLLGLALRAMRALWARLALGATAAFLLVGLLQHERALGEARALAQSRGHVPERLLVKPTIGNLVLWRSVYIAGDRIHADGVRVALPGNVRVYAGASARRVDPERDLDLPAHSVQRTDVRRFVRFADGFPVRHPERTDVIGDGRYALLPTSVTPLWGIVLDPGAPHAHARFESFRTLTPQLRRDFIDMLLGRDPGRSARALDAHPPR